jgi:hypothetical protein
MPDPVGALTRAYLTRVGYTTQKIDSWNSRTRLLQDVGITGDNAWDEIQIMHREFGVDLTGFFVDDYFPSELSTAALVLRFLPRSGWAGRIRQRYPELTLSLVEEILGRKRWRPEN